MTIPRYILILVILDLIFAFAGKLNHGNILAAELERILHGLQFCHDRHLWNTTIDNLIIHHSSEAWKYSYTFRRILRLLVLFQCLTHTT